MKRVIKLLLIIMIFTFSFKVNAITKSELVDEINSTMPSVNNSIVKFKNFSSLYADEIDSVVKELSSDFTNNHDDNINLIYNHLSGESKTDFGDIKDDLSSSLDKLDELFDSMKAYFSNQNNIDAGFPGSVDVFEALKTNLSTMKTNLKNLIEIYLDNYYNKIYIEIEEYTTINEVLSIYDELYTSYENMDEVKANIEEKISFICDVYNDYYLDDFKETFKEILEPITNLIDEKFNELYDKFEEKLQSKLELDVTNIDNECDLLDQQSIVEHNVKLINMIKLVTNNENRISKIFNDITKNFTVDRLTNKINTYKTKIEDRLDEAESYIRDHLLESNLLNVKRESDEKYFKINDIEKKVVFSDVETEESKFLDKLESIGTLSIDNDYNGRVGTGSIIKVNVGTYTEDYLVVVKGDVKANGLVDISDVAKLAAHLLNPLELTELEEEAADIVNNNKIDISDVAYLASELLK